MAYRNLQTYLKALKERGELLVSDLPLSPVLEIPHLAERLVKTGGPAVLFTQPAGAGFPLAMNLFGSPSRMSLALGRRDLGELEAVLGRFLALNPGEIVRAIPDLAAFFPRRVIRAPVQEVIWRGADIDLGRLPITQSWPQDAGRFITLPLVITRDPESRALNVGMYRMQVLGPDATAMHWQRHKVGAAQYAQSQEKFPVAVALGGDPALIYAATAPIPPVPLLDEFRLAGVLRGRGIELVRGVSVSLPVPAQAEFILEGYVDPAEDPVSEGPFGDHTGFYTPPEPYPVFHLTAITHRKNPVYPATIVGPPPMEDAYLIEATERLFAPALRMVLPQLVDYHLPPAGIAHNWVNVQIKKRYPGEAYQVAHGLLGLGQMMFAKLVWVVDSDVPIRPGFEAWLQGVANFVPGLDSVLTRGPMDVLDHAARGGGFGGKLILDATRKLPEESRGQIAPVATSAELPQLAEIAAQKQWPGIWALSTPVKTQAEAWRLAEQLVASPAALGIRILLLADTQTDPHNPDQILWAVLNNLEPERDSRVLSGSGGPVLVLDGRPKLTAEGARFAWPEIAQADLATMKRIEEIWPKLAW